MKECAESAGSSKFVHVLRVCVMFSWTPAGGLPLTHTVALVTFRERMQRASLEADR